MSEDDESKTIGVWTSVLDQLGRTDLEKRVILDSLKETRESGEDYRKTKEIVLQAIKLGKWLIATAAGLVSFLLGIIVYLYDKVQP